MADYQMIKNDFMSRTYTNQNQQESVFGIQRDRFKQNPIWKIIDDRREKGVPIDQIHNDATLKLKASDLVFNIFHELNLEKKPDAFATLAMNIALNFGLKVALETVSNTTNNSIKELWLELYVALSRKKTMTRAQVLEVIPLGL